MSVSSSRAVSISTGTGRSRCTRRHTSRPSSPGSIRSSTTRSGRTPVAQRDAGGAVVRPPRRRSPRPAAARRRPPRSRPRPRSRRSAAPPWAECATAIWEPCAALVQVWCRIIVMQLTADPARDPAGGVGGALRCWWTPCSIPRARAPVPNTAERSPQPALRPARARRQVVVAAPRRGARHPPARRPPRRDRASSCCPTTSPVLCQPPDDERAARPRLHRRAPGRRRRELRRRRRRPHRAASTAPARSARRWRPCPASCSRAPGEPTLYIAGDTILCDEVRRRARPRTRPTWWSSTPAAPASRGRPDRDGRRRRRRRRRAAPDAHDRRRPPRGGHHCLETRADLRQRLRAEGLDEPRRRPARTAAMPL